MRTATKAEVPGDASYNNHVEPRASSTPPKLISTSAKQKQQSKSPPTRKRPSGANITLSEEHAGAATPDAAMANRNKPSRPSNPYRDTLGCFGPSPRQPSNLQPTLKSMKKAPSTESSSDASQPTDSSFSPPARSTRRHSTSEAMQPTSSPQQQPSQPVPGTAAIDSPSRLLPEPPQKIDSSEHSSNATEMPSDSESPQVSSHHPHRHVHPNARAMRSATSPLHQPSRPANHGPRRPTTGRTQPVYRSSASAPRRAQTTEPSRPAFQPSGSPSPMRNTSGRHQNGALIQGDKSWMDLPECSVFISNLPESYTTLDVYKLLENEGSISKIRIRGSRMKPNASVDFCPPPKKAFWDFPVRLPGSDASVRVQLNAPNRSYLIASPINPEKKYPERFTLNASRLDFGFMYDAKSMMAMAKMVPAGERRIEMALNLSRKEIDVQFYVELRYSTSTSQTLHHKYRFRLPFAQLQRIYEVRLPGSMRCELVIPFEMPPAFFKQTNNIPLTHQGDVMFWSEWQTWYRQTNILHRWGNKDVERNAIDLRNRNAVIDFGRWTIYRFVFDAAKNIASTKEYSVLREVLDDHNIPTVPLEQFEVRERVEADFWDLLDGAYHKSLHDQSQFGSLNSSTISLEFSVRYQLQVCLSHGWLNEHNITREFLTKLSAMDPSNARYILEKTADKQCRTWDPMEIFKIPVKDSGKIRLPKYCVYARSATITPSMLYINTPTTEISNRVVRYGSELQDRFLRVKFTDEKVEGRINSQDDDRFEEVFRRIKQAMTEGIIVGDRHYLFLAFGNSQFREHGAYFFAPLEGSETSTRCTVEDLREWMGDFRPIKSISKYAARLGQCFSTSRAITAGRNVNIVEIQDIKNGDYCFTDGVGKISSFLALMVAHEFGLPGDSDDHPSLVQFRLGGCKGVLAVSPEVKAYDIMIRPSQKKFDATHQGLEIIRISSFATACLNRQLIIVLSTLGVPDRIFTDMQKKMLAELSRAMVDPNIAVEKLRRNIDLNQMSLTLAGMIADGFMEMKDPFMMSVLHLWRSYTIKYLKEKARIVVEDGAFLLGCTDETATLRGHYSKPQDQYDATRQEKLATLPEIFLQISDQDKKGSYKIIEGLCILARNPSLHPGDIRIVRAINVPALRHLKNVVVLPQTGDRDIANMCSGGDLDGDDYLVIWDQDLIPKFTINNPAMNYETEPTREVSGDVSIAQVIDFYIQYMKNDSLGQIANAHLATADRSPNGVLDENCLKLAALHSRAVDFPKSGNPAVMGKQLKPLMYPHFMESKYRAKDRIYTSNKILGQLYDQVERANFTPLYDNPFDSRILDAYQLDQGTLSSAARIKELYDADIRRVQAQHGIKTEFEVWTTFVLEHNLESRDYSFAEELGRISSGLKKKFQDMCIEAAGATSINDMQNLKPFIVAMYKVTAQEMATALEECDSTKLVAGRETSMRDKTIQHMPLMSFPWIFVSQLGEIANPTVIRAAPAADQGPRHRTKKQSSLLSDLHAAPGAVQTKAGIIQPGKMLVLFDDKPESHQDGSSNPEASDHAAMIERGIQGPALEMQQSTNVSAQTSGKASPVGQPSASHIMNSIKHHQATSNDAKPVISPSISVSRAFPGAASDHVEPLDKKQSTPALATTTSLESTHSISEEEDEDANEGEEIHIEMDDKPTALEALNNLFTED
ncbi:RdRP-domain-containing protein [Mytilinidion resinicola]|uniref:RdRP-domain-containing protein n=1 Tax=Mytilinidion resinicola TaxID=574789 RepID=A0A6A6YBK9_9PEZI|nr:RdRP-domain-containing protein [Mytilinidion resinicola]KAF2805227.1 RdRP-domain-containing protein [Mytilinidion resinicola]